MPLSATTSGISDVKEVVKVAKNEQQMFKRKTILFVDEIHRFNKLQQVHLSLYYSYQDDGGCQTNLVNSATKYLVLPQ